MNLKKVRNKIDSLDIQISDLLHKRMEYALMAMEYKDTVCDPAREKAIHRNVLSRTSTLLDANFIKELYGLIIEKSKQLQESKLKDRKPEKSRKNMEVQQ
jgi:chorismate mutase